MDESITSFVGLDVHKDSIAIAVAEGRDAPRFLGTVQSELQQLLKAFKGLGKAQSVLVVYEAGPCGYGLYRQLRSRGYGCAVIAASRMSRPRGERIKTDRRDALTLARLARSGDLVRVLVPDERDEAMRDLSRAREDALAARLKARQQLKALLLRHGRRYPGKSSWTLAHERYLSAVSFEHAAQEIAFVEYRHAVREAHERVERFTGKRHAEAVIDVQGLMSARRSLTSAISNAAGSKEPPTHLSMLA
jgi:transposase